KPDRLTGHTPGPDLPERGRGAKLSTGNPLRRAGAILTHRTTTMTTLLLLAAVLAADQAPKPAAPTEPEKKALEQIRNLGGLALELAQNDSRLEVSYPQAE